MIEIEGVAGVDLIAVEVFVGGQVEEEIYETMEGVLNVLRLVMIRLIMFGIPQRQVKHDSRAGIHVSKILICTI